MVIISYISALYGFVLLWHVFFFFPSQLEVGEGSSFIDS